MERPGRDGGHTRNHAPNGKREGRPLIFARCIGVCVRPLSIGRWNGAFFRRAPLNSAKFRLLARPRLPRGFLRRVAAAFTRAAISREPGGLNLSGERASDDFAIISPAVFGIRGESGRGLLGFTRRWVVFGVYGVLIRFFY